MSLVITIDGPAASGKSSVSREVASHLGWSWVSTGAFYRGLAYFAKAKGVALESEEALVEACKSDSWKVHLSSEKTLVFCDGKDVTESIYSDAVGTVASQVSQFPLVRKQLLQAQRNCAYGVNLIAEGRDCGTVVFPEADLKFYITASGKDRAQRRAMEEGKTIAEVEQSQTVRDQQDTQRKSSPLQIPENAHVVDTSDMDLQQVVRKVEETIKETLKI